MELLHQRPRRPSFTHPPKRLYRVEFPPPEGDEVDQDEASFFLVDGKVREEVRFHDYARIYAHPGLYEQLFYDRLKCRSPTKVVDTLQRTLVENGRHLSGLRVLDFGAGNGMVGERLWSHGVARLVGVDILEAAAAAASRDRPGVYDGYYVHDFCQLDDDQREELQAWSFDALCSVAALGFGDIPPLAWANTLDLVEVGGWIAFNIKDSFLDHSDSSGFSAMVRELIFSEYMELHHLERYRHRLSIHGTPLHYYAIVGRKQEADLPASVLAFP